MMDRELRREKRMKQADDLHVMYTWKNNLTDR